MGPIDEVLKKWCPVDVNGYRERVPSTVEEAREGGRRQYPSCIGPDCMAFRWYKHKHDVGYCGLAGKP
jgi:hypothetical protein